MPAPGGHRQAGLEEHLHRQAGIVRNALAAVLITDPEAHLPGRALRYQVPSLRQVVTTAELQAGAGRGGHASTRSASGAPVNSSAQAARFPRRAAIGDPFLPDGAGWTAALVLRDRARAAVLALCAEPDTG